MNVPYKYNVEKTVNYITQNYCNRSKTMCAWYVMRGLQAGGTPCGIYPAYAYNEILPRLGFQEIEPENLQKGDICVLSQNSKSSFGHIAIFNGNQWISDYKQKSIYPNMAYKNESKCQFFRQTNGWHTANIWISPLKLLTYIKVLVFNFSKIKFT